MKVPVRIEASWLDSLKDAELLRVESQLHKTFSKAETAEKRLRGARYDMLRGSAELLSAWDCWSKANRAARIRGLHPQRA